MNHNEKVLFELYCSIRKQNNISLLNDDKVLPIIQYWFAHFFFMIHNVAKNNLTISETDIKALQRSILYSPYITGDDSKKSFINASGKLVHYLTSISNFLFISKLYRPKVGVLPGGLSNGFLDRLKYRLLLIKMNYAKVSIEHTFQAQFLKQTKKVLGENENYDLLLKLIPEVFFANRLKNNYHFPTKYKGALNCFLDNNYIYIKMLLCENKIHLTGIQHGGCYGEWIINPFERFELDISDAYYGWGLLKNNISQNRFHKLLRNKSIEKSRIYWIGRDYSTFVGIDSLSFDKFEDHMNDVSHISFFSKIFRDHEIDFLKHPRNSHYIYNEIFTSENKYTCNTETLISDAKLVIFDCMCHTLMYYCIFYEIPFVILLNKFPVEGLTQRALDFYSVLDKNNILISVQDRVSTNSKLSLLMSYLDNNYNNFFNDELKAFFELHFRSELSVKDI